MSRVDGAETSVTLSRDALDALAQAEFETETSWTTGVQRFRGVRGSALAALFPDGAETVTAIALNDYVVAIPLSDFTADRLLLATSRNGAPMRIRDNGPYWLIYEFDSLSSQQRVIAETRSIWQLAALVVE